MPRIFSVLYAVAFFIPLAVMWFLLSCGSEGALVVDANGYPIPESPDFSNPPPGANPPAPPIPDAGPSLTTNDAGITLIWHSDAGVECQCEIKKHHGKHQCGCPHQTKHGCYR